MSYRGRPSKGCDFCRSKKVKCDETKPTCNRCNKAGRNCHYRDPGDVFFRNQTAIAAQKAEESWRKRSTKAVSRADSDASHDSPPSDSASESSALPNLGGLSLSHQPNLNLRQLAYQRFLYDFVIITDQQDPEVAHDGLLDFLPEFCDRAGEDTCLSEAVSAVSYANFHQRMRSSEAGLLAKEHYLKAIKLLRRDLMNSEKAELTDVLTAVYLMGLWEILTSNEHDGSFIAHKNGADNLLKLWQETDPDIFSNAAKERLYSTTISQMLLGGLQTTTPPPLPAETYFPRSRSRVGLQLLQLFHGATSTHARWRHNYPRKNTVSREHPLGNVSTEDPSPAVQELFRSALKLNDEFQEWEANLPESWRYKVVLNTPSAWSSYDPLWVNLLLNLPGAPTEMHFYTSLKKTWLRNFFRCARIFLVRDLLEMIRYINEHLDAQFIDEQLALDLSLDKQQSQLTTQLQVLVHQICASLMGCFTTPIPSKPIRFPSSNTQSASPTHFPSSTNSVPSIATQDIAGIRGHMSHFPLTVVIAALNCGLLPQSSLDPILGFDIYDRSEWIQGVLQFISRDLGIRKAEAAIKYGLVNDRSSVD